MHSCTQGGTQREALFAALVDLQMYIHTYMREYLAIWYLASSFMMPFLLSLCGRPGAIHQVYWGVRALLYSRWGVSFERGRLLGRRAGGGGKGGSCVLTDMHPSSGLR